MITTPSVPITSPRPWSQIMLQVGLGLLRLMLLIVAVVAAALSATYFYEVRTPSGGQVSIYKLLAGSLAAYLAAGGIGVALLASAAIWVERRTRRTPVHKAGALALGLWLVLGGPLTVLLGGTVAVLSTRYVLRATAPHDGFTRAFGSGWQDQIPPAQAARMLQQRWSWRVPAAPEPRWEQDIPFWTIPGRAKPLLCDIWQPPAGVPPSGLAFIYLHGGGWNYLDKDFAGTTRPFFRHLAAQGHVVMDVGYRIAPEAQIPLQVQDAKRALIWLKHNAAQYAIDPNRIVLGGASSGGNVALLAAYAPAQPQWTPPELSGEDSSVSGVVSLYGPTDLRAYDARMGPVMGCCADPVAAGEVAGWALLLNKLSTSLYSFGEDAAAITFYSHQDMLTNALGGPPDEVPEMVDLVSPVIHVQPGVPPSLIFQGVHDDRVWVEATRAMVRKLEQVGAPVVYVEFPQTDHAFDIILPEFSPATQAAWYDLDRFLALLAARGAGEAQGDAP